MNSKRDILNKVLPIITIACIFCLWSIASAVIGSEYILPSVNQTLSALLKLFYSGEFYLSVAMTFLRSFIAFLISFVAAFLLARIRCKFEISSRVIEPVIGVIRALPTIAVILLLLFWTNSRVAPIIVTVLVVLPTSYTNLVTAFNGVDKTTVEAGAVDGANVKQLFALVEFPQIEPAFYKSIGSGISLNFKLMVAAEVLAQTANSLGYLLNTSKVYFEIPQMMALVLVSVLIGVAVESLFNKIALKKEQ
jgi:NitT/TauT family transport system permease protein